MDRVTKWLGRLGTKRQGIDYWIYKLNKSLRNTICALQRWNMERFGYAHLKINDLEEELGKIHLQEDDGHPLAKQEEIRHLLKVQRNIIESIYI